MNAWRSVLQPRGAVVRPLPWDTVPPRIPTATRLRPLRRVLPPAGRNRVAVRFIVGTRSQGWPHFIRPTLGWRTESRWDKNHVALNSHLSYANGVPPSSPG